MPASTSTPAPTSLETVVPFDSIAFLRSVADHAETYGLHGTIISALGYYPQIQVGPSHHAADDTDIRAFCRWADTLDNLVSVTAKQVGDGVHLTADAKLADGTRAAVVVVVNGAETQALLDLSPDIEFTMDAGMTPAEARRLIADLQHAVALAEEQPAVSEAQPKPSRCTGCGEPARGPHVRWCPAVSEDQPTPRAFLRRYANKLRQDLGENVTRQHVMQFADAYAEGWAITDAEADFVMTELSEVLADSEQVRHG